MSNIYGQMLLEQGNIEEAESNYEQALEFYAQAEGNFVRDADIEECLETKIKMMRIYRQQAKFSKMKSLLEEALHLINTHEIIGFKGKGIFSSGLCIEPKQTIHCHCSISIRH